MRGMGIGDIELLMECEDEFDIKIDDDTAYRIQTVGHLVRAVAEIHGMTAHLTCRTSRTFYALRRQLIRELGIDRAAIKPKTPLHILLSKDKHDALREVLRDQGLDKLPVNWRTAGLSGPWGCMLLVFLPLILVAWLISDALGVTVSFIFLVSIFAGPVMQASQYLNQRGYHTIPHWLTVRDVVMALTPEHVSYARQREEYAALRLKIREIVAEQAQLPLAQVTESSNLYHDMYL
jgi:hypothetical protein